MKQEGFAQETGVLSEVVRYEKLRWYGNGTVQAALWILFLVCFSAGMIAGVRRGLTRSFHHQKGPGPPASDRIVRWKRALCSLNLLILVTFSIPAWWVSDQLHPSCPAVLTYLPLLGTVSTLATVALLMVLVRTRRDPRWTVARRIRGSLEVCCLIVFVPCMFYWNLIGYHF